jgi:2-polyprenyl-6-hydroxyphenyl methylase/3-demethylubiquinone-9 3-methyltransferase
MLRLQRHRAARLALSGGWPANVPFSGRSVSAATCATRVSSSGSYRAFGPFEHWVTAAYRAIYVDLDDYVEAVHAWVPHARRILEVGCGEGAVTERLVAAYPEAHITAIDITPRVGRLYRGPKDRVRFQQCTVQEIAVQESGGFDLAMIADVMHHVPDGLRKGLLDAVKACLASGGSLVFKEWERTRTPIHWMCHASDRWLTGDRVSYLSRDEGRTLLARSFNEAALVDEHRVAPWRNNIMTLVRPR